MYNYAAAGARVLLCFSLFLAADCGVRRYTNLELQKKTAYAFPKEYEEIIVPLDSALMPVRKRMFFLKNEIKELKDKLWDGGTNQRVARIDNTIDTIRKEISGLSAIRKEILNAIYIIYPAYEEPDIFLYKGEKTQYDKITKRIMLITLQDQQEYLNSRSEDEKMSQTLVYKPLIKTAMAQFKSLPDSLKPKLRPIGSPGPIRKVEPYTPPSAK